MSSSCISFFPESTINNSQELVWKATERRGGKKKKGIKPYCSAEQQDLSWLVWENSWELVALFHCQRCPQNCSLFCFQETRAWFRVCWDAKMSCKTWHRLCACDILLLPSLSLQPPLPMRWGPHQAITGIFCVMAIKEIWVHKVCITSSSVQYTPFH